MAKKTLKNLLTFLVAVIIVVILGLLAAAITERRGEQTCTFKPVVKIDEWEPRNYVWGMNFPDEYETYMQTADTTFRSKYNGSAFRDMLEENPRLVILWAGYGFSKDYNQGRGHYYAVEDVWKTLRTGAPMSPDEGPMPATCWTCKSSDVPRLMNEMGVAEFYKGKWAAKGDQIYYPIGCVDCHDPKTMKLRISRPALIEALQEMGVDVEKLTHQEMRSLVCAQCHVEYYFDKKKYEGVPYLTFPWKYGMSVEAMEKYYDSIQHVDWVHKLSKAPMLKAQHPGYELYLTGIHAKRGVSCADCHMPYKTVGGRKFTDHKIQSPLNNIENTCQVCHKQSAEELIRDVYERQDKIVEARTKLEDLLVKAHIEAKLAWDLGATEEQMKDILQGIRKAQWRWDYAAASHGAAFHAPEETARIISDAIVIIQETRIKLAKLLYELGHRGPIEYPDISTKEKAQRYIGLDPEEMKKAKQEFLEKVVPQWIKKYKEREKQWKIEYCTTNT